MKRILICTIVVLTSMAAKAEAQESCTSVLECTQLAVEAAQIANDRMDALEKRIPFIQSGTIVPTTDEIAEFRDKSKSVDSNGRCVSGSSSHRGILSRAVQFETPYNATPQIVLALTEFQSVGPVRVVVTHSNVTATGFTARIITYCDTLMYDVQMSWLAIGS
jgi:hypothetical protein